MKFIHLSDLHLGKRVNDYSMIEDQKYILNEIIKVIDTEKPDSILISGDVYDKNVPSSEAVQLFDDFLTNLSLKDLKVYIISGNHDSAERLSFASKLIEKSGIYISKVFNGKVETISTSDSYGKINIHLLPFIKPIHVKRFYEDEEILSYTDAMRVVIKNMSLNKNERNILLTHQFITGSIKSESEEINVGTLDNVDVNVFEDFDYVALGHIHRPQNCSKKVRYCGTPLKYSFSEANDKKSVSVVEIKEKGNLEIKEVHLKPLHDLVEIKGKYNDLVSKTYYENTTLTSDYVHITLTDEEDIIDAIYKLRIVYKNLMKLDYDNTRTRKSVEIDSVQNLENKNPLELFSEFYKLQNNQDLNEEQENFMKHLIEEIWEGEK